MDLLRSVLRLDLVKCSLVIKLALSVIVKQERVVVRVFLEVFKNLQFPNREGVFFNSCEEVTGVLPIDEELDPGQINL